MVKRGAGSMLYLEVVAGVCRHRGGVDRNGDTENSENQEAAKRMHDRMWKECEEVRKSVRMRLRGTTDYAARLNREFVSLS